MPAWRSRFLRVAALTVGLLLVVPVGVVRGATFTFDVNLNSRQTSGTGLPSTLHTVTLYSADGAFADRSFAMSAANGHWFVSWDVPVVAGSKIRVAAAGDSRLITVPQLSIRANRVTDVVSGHAPAGSHVLVLVGHNPTLDAFDQVSFSANVTADGSGRWSRDFTSEVNIDGNDGVTVVLNKASGDEFATSGRVPYMSIRRASSAVIGSVNNGASATLKLRRPDGTLRATATLSWKTPGFDLNGYFANSAGHLVAAKAGDKVVASFGSNATMVIPAITVAGDASTDTVTGHCIPNAPYQLTLHLAGGGSSTAYGVTDGSGNVMDVMGGVEIDDSPTLTCRFPTGDQVSVNGFIVP
jgi:hypothetical protein